MSESNPISIIQPELQRKYAMELTAEIIRICNDHPDAPIRDSLIFQLMLGVTKGAVGYVAGFKDGSTAEREHCAKIAEEWKSQSNEGYCDDEIAATTEIAARIREGKS